MEVHSDVCVCVCDSADLSAENVPTIHVPQAVDLKPTTKKYKRNDYSDIRLPAVHVHSGV